MDRSLLDMAGPYSRQWAHLVGLQNLRPSPMVQAAVCHITPSIEAGMVSDTSVDETRKESCLQTLRHIQSASRRSEAEPRIQQPSLQSRPKRKRSSSEGAVGPRRGLLCLPNEMQFNVLQRLTVPEVAQLAKTCAYYSTLCIPFLYAHAIVHGPLPRWGELCQFGCLIKSPHLQTHVRNLELTCRMDVGTAREIFLKSAMDLVRCTADNEPRLLSLKWTDRFTSSVAAILTERLPSSLERLEILVPTRMPSSSDKRSLSNQLRLVPRPTHGQGIQQTLKHLRVDIPSYAPKQLSSLLVRALHHIATVPSALSYLGLKGVVLHDWTFGRLCSLKTLCLLGCEGLDTALSSWMYDSRESNLTRFELFTAAISSELIPFLSHESCSRLEIVKLLVQRSQILPLDFALSGPIRILLVEARTNIMNPRSVALYPMSDVELLVNRCLHLESLGVAVNLHRKTSATIVSLEISQLPRRLLTSFAAKQNTETSPLAVPCFPLRTTPWT